MKPHQIILVALGIAVVLKVLSKKKLPKSYTQEEFEVLKVDEKK